LHYQWQRDSGSGFVNVGTDQATYALGDADVGATIRVVTTYTDQHGTPESKTSAATAAVANVNDAPTAANDANAVAQRLTVTGSVRANDGDIDNALATLTVTNVAYNATHVDQAVVSGGTVVNGANGKLTINPDGTYSYVADHEGLVVGQVVTDTFDYTIKDPSGASATAQLTVTVTGSATGDANANILISDGSAHTLTGTWRRRHPDRRRRGGRLRLRGHRRQHGRGLRHHHRLHPRRGHAATDAADHRHDQADPDHGRNRQDPVDRPGRGRHGRGPDQGAGPRAGGDRHRHRRGQFRLHHQWLGRRRNPDRRLGRRYHQRRGRRGLDPRRRRRRRPRRRGGDRHLPLGAGDSTILHWDTITDFATGEDKLDISAADAGTVAIARFGSSTFVYFGSGASAGVVQINGDIKTSDLIVSGAVTWLHVLRRQRRPRP
jgi:VCBS repeat-containing protein